MSANFSALGPAGLSNIVQPLADLAFIAKEKE